MDTRPETPASRQGRRTNSLLVGLTLGFAGMAALFVANVWGHPAPRAVISPVDKTFLETTPWRQPYPALVGAKENLSDYDCYGCHEKNKLPPIRYDANQKIIIPK